MKEYRKILSNLWGKWKKNAAVVIVCVLLTVLGFVFYGLAMAQKQELKVFDERITLIRTDGSAYSWTEAEQMRLRNQELDEPLSYALWGDEGIHLLQNTDLGRYAEAELYVVEGSSDLLFDSSVILDGMVKKSCLLGEDTAQSLFGVADATGLSITMDGQDYVVLGMLKSAEQGAVFLAKDLDTYALDRMNVRVSGDITLSALEQSVQWEIGFAGKALDYRFINWLLGLFGIIMCLLLWIWLLRLMGAELKKYRQQCLQNVEYYKNGYRIDPAYVKGFALRMGLIFGVILLFGVFLRFQVKIPEDLIPTKWSDFDFWSRLISEKSERMLNWIRCEKRAPELFYLGKTVRAALYLALSYSCYIILRSIWFGRNTVRK